MVDLWPICVFEDRYEGCYSGGKWIAVAKCDMLVGHQLGVAGGPTHFSMAFDHSHSDDIAAAEFGVLLALVPWIGVGETPEEAIRNLREKTETVPQGEW